ncbi:hypothetical protein FG379_001411 [Cryptosporidium bovis]|uniref:uncharacterized protein n=1 Tax=Cryptosporidium bovis TaxID=310047 RepID=UPI00351A59FC|nr:hypothetical protein FG379_001411 [Cryptosporidium bovis]
MTSSFLSYLEHFFVNHNKCCSNLINFEKKETIQCIDLDPPQIINTISDFKDGGVVGFDISQKDKFQDLLKEVRVKIFGKVSVEQNEMDKIDEMNKKNRTTLSEEVNVPRLDLKKKTRVIKFEEEE